MTRLDLPGNTAAAHCRDTENERLKGRHIVHERRRRSLSDMLAQKRLVQEIRALNKNPPQFIRVTFCCVCMEWALPFVDLSHFSLAAALWWCSCGCPHCLQAVPLENNFLEFHYVIQGPPDSLYAGMRV
jgi:hypothetical protein